MTLRVSLLGSGGKDTPRVVYWQHSTRSYGWYPCPVEHRWLWTSRLHYWWWLARGRVGNAVMVLGARIAGEYER